MPHVSSSVRHPDKINGDKRKLLRLIRTRSADNKDHNMLCRTALQCKQQQQVTAMLMFCVPPGGGRRVAPSAWLQQSDGRTFGGDAQTSPHPASVRPSMECVPPWLAASFSFVRCWRWPKKEQERPKQSYGILYETTRS